MGGVIMNVHVSESWEPFIRSQMQSGRYRSEKEVLDEALRLLKQRDQGQGAADQAEPAASEPVPAWQRVLDNMKVVPDEVFDRIPADSSEQLDHYLYGTPKRPAQ
jgi:putative addiction module CopG family antidote